MDTRAASRGLRPISEAQLFRAYGRTVVVRPCVCGGSIAAERDDWEEIGEAIREHGNTPLHEAWRAWLAAQ